MSSPRYLSEDDKAHIVLTYGLPFDHPSRRSIYQLASLFGTSKLKIRQVLSDAGLAVDHVKSTDRGPPAQVSEVLFAKRMDGRRYDLNGGRMPKSKSKPEISAIYMDEGPWLTK